MKSTALDLSVCNFCGGSEFVTGPKGRLSRNQKFPCCKNCGSLERHRVLRQVYIKLREICPFDRYSCLHISEDISVKPEWFNQYELSVYGGKNSIDLQEIDRPDDKYDVVVCNHVLEHVENDVKALSELFRIFNQNGFFQLSVPQPITIKETTDWGYADKSQFGHYRIYGIDIEEKFQQAMSPDICYLKVIAFDPVTQTQDMCFLFFKSKGFASLVNTMLSNSFTVQSVNL
jgi:SAM-dependent methyltransferase